VLYSNIYNWNFITTYFSIWISP